MYCVIILVVNCYDTPYIATNPYHYTDQKPRNLYLTLIHPTALEVNQRAIHEI